MNLLLSSKFIIKLIYAMKIHRHLKLLRLLQNYERCTLDACDPWTSPNHYKFNFIFLNFDYWKI